MKWLLYAAGLLAAVFAPSWWSGFIVGVGTICALYDIATWEATRRHRKEDASWAAHRREVLSRPQVPFDHEEGGGEL